MFKWFFRKKKRSSAGKEKDPVKSKAVGGRRLPVCENCGTTVDHYSQGLSAACNLQGKTLCVPCYKKLQKTATGTCRDCGITVPVADIKANRCPECWRKQLGELRTFYAGYHTRLAASLLEKGISVAPAGTNYLDDAGKAAIVTPLP